MSNTNDNLHQQALDILKRMRPTKDEQAARDKAANYNVRRREETLAFGEVASRVWEKLEAGETVGGVNAKEAWCSVVGVKIRWAQTAIARFRGDAVSAPSDPNLKQALGATINSVGIVKNSAYAGIEIEERYEFTYLASESERRYSGDYSYRQKQRKDGLVKWTHPVNSVHAGLTITVESQMVQLKKEMPCSACGGSATVADGNYGKHVVSAERGAPYCKMSGQPVIVGEKQLVAALYKKVERTLRGMRLWRDELRQQLDAAAQESIDYADWRKEQRSEAARRGAETRKKKAAAAQPVAPKTFKKGDEVVYMDVKWRVKSVRNNGTVLDLVADRYQPTSAPPEQCETYDPALAV